tara:strand:- start:46 stop:666 length:621 start_codon:yes stop_codon:yes gene_type:complete
MKKIFTYCSLFVLTLFFSVSSIAQFSGSVYYGLPNTLSAGVVLNTNYLSEVYATPTDISYSSLGPVGLWASYQTESKIGIGLDLNFSRSSAEFEYWNGFNDSISGDVYTMNASRNIFRAMLRFDAHFGDNEIVDPFMSLGIGYRTTGNSYTSTRPGYIEEPTETLIPISFRLAAGANIYVVENIGILLEAGLFGGGLLRVGATYRM